jgi:photosystem II stability/assembly factor-like uncharacterized protein
MLDEIDLLRRFRADTPDPDEAAWSRARAALAEARSDPSGSHGSAGRRHQIRWRAPGRRIAIPVAAAIVVAVAATLTVLATHGPPTLTRTLTSAWQPARQLPGNTRLPSAAPGTWQLAGYLVARGWQENTAGPEPGVLTCATAATCYVEGDSTTSPSGPADMNSFYVSTDGARTWGVLPVPHGVTFTSALTCPSAADCAAGGLYYGHQPVYLTTTSGGHSWTVSPLPAAVGQVIDLDCTTATKCQGLASAAPNSPVFSFWGLYSNMNFVVTSDGGRHFAVVPFPKWESIQTVTCPTASHCVAIGLYTKATPRSGPDIASGVLLTSDDGGLTWRQRVWPKGYGPGPFPTVTCADASRCAMIGYVERNGTMKNQVGFTSGKDAIQYTVIAFSSDGGVTWTASTLPRSIPYPMIDTLACPTARTCYGAGSDFIAQRIGNAHNASSSVVAVTHDAGRTWQRVTFAVPTKVPGGMQGDSFMQIGQIECPVPDACVAVGISDQGSTATPIYIFQG